MDYLFSSSKSGLLIGVLAMVMHLPHDASAQGLVVFRNDSASAVYVQDLSQPDRYFPVDGRKNEFLVALYSAPGGPETAPVNLAFVQYTGFSYAYAGYFNGGLANVPWGEVPITTESQHVWVQIRVWERAYGNTYEEAIAAGEINGRPALRGESNIFNLLTYGHNFTLITGPGMLRPIYVSVPEPSSWALALLGLGAFLGVRKATKHRN